MCTRAYLMPKPFHFEMCDVSPVLKTYALYLCNGHWELCYCLCLTTKILLFFAILCKKAFCKNEDFWNYLVFTYYYHKKIGLVFFKKYTIFNYLLLKNARQENFMVANVFIRLRLYMKEGLRDYFSSICKMIWA